MKHQWTRPRTHWPNPWLLHQGQFLSPQPKIWLITLTQQPNLLHRIHLVSQTDFCLFLWNSEKLFEACAGTPVQRPHHHHILQTEPGLWKSQFSFLRRSEPFRKLLSFRLCRIWNPWKVPCSLQGWVCLHPGMEARCTDPATSLHPTLSLIGPPLLLGAPAPSSEHASSFPPNLSWDPSLPHSLSHVYTSFRPMSNLIFSEHPLLNISLTLFSLWIPRPLIIWDPVIDSLMLLNSVPCTSWIIGKMVTSGL